MDVCSHRKIKRDSPEEASVKNIHQSVIGYSLDLLCTSACDLIKTTMIENYGNKWFDNCQEILEENCKVNNDKWKKLEKDMHNWEHTACLSVLIHAKKHDFIFKSLTAEKVNFDFCTLATDVKKVRNWNCHSLNYKDIIMEFYENMGIIMKFLKQLESWYKLKSKKDELLNTARAMALIEYKYHGLFQSKIKNWNDMHKSLDEFNEKKLYILITKQLQASQYNLQGLCSIPWCCVIVVDFSSNSNLLQMLEMCCQVEKKSDEEVIGTDRIGKEGKVCYYNISLPGESQLKMYQKLLQCMKNSSFKTFVVFLCFDMDVIINKKDLLKSLHKVSVELFEEDHVFFITDSFIDEIPCWRRPLAHLCHCILQKPYCEYKDPIVLPTISGRLTFEGSETHDTTVCSIRESFEIVHIDIHKQELKEILGCNTKVDFQQLFNVKKNLTERFIKGANISWLSFCLEVDIRRDLTKGIEDKINMVLAADPIFSNSNMHLIELSHDSKTGASTLARRILYDFREKCICLALLDSCKYLDIATIFENVLNLYQKCHCGILLLVDERPDFTLQLYNKFENKPLPIILLCVTSSQNPQLYKCITSSPQNHQLYKLNAEFSKRESKLLEINYRNYQDIIRQHKIFNALSLQNNQKTSINVVSFKYGMQSCMQMELSVYYFRCYK